MLGGWDMGQVIQNTDHGKRLKSMTIPALVRELTVNAMGGNVTFRKALEDRLDIIRPSQAQIREFAKHPPTFTPGIKVY